MQQRLLGPQSSRVNLRLLTHSRVSVVACAKRGRKPRLQSEDESAGIDQEIVSTRGPSEVTFDTEAGSTTPVGRRGRPKAQAAAPLIESDASDDAQASTSYNASQYASDEEYNIELIGEAGSAAGKKRRGRPRRPQATELSSDDEGYDDAAGPYSSSLAIDEELRAIDDSRFTIGQMIEEHSIEEPMEVPRQFQPKNWAETYYLEAVLTQERWFRRKQEQLQIEDAAWQSHHRQNREAVNRYATVRRVAGIMAEIENADFAREDKSPQHIAPWARAEIVFAPEFDQFNKEVAENIENIIKRWPKEAEEEELDLMDDALFLLNRDEDNVLARKLEQQSEDHVLVDQYLDGVLPGVTLSSLSEAYASDIFDGGDEDELVGDELLAGFDLEGVAAAAAAAKK